jgi:hypothetical protein
MGVVVTDEAEGTAQIEPTGGDGASPDEVARISESEGDGAILGGPENEQESSEPVSRIGAIIGELSAHLPELVTLFLRAWSSALPTLPGVAGTAIVLRPGAAGGDVRGRTPILDLPVVSDGRVLASYGDELKVDVSRVDVDTANRLTAGRRYRVLILLDE